jgi:hypothetical protein
VPKKQTVFVVVDHAWFDVAMRPLITGTESGSAVGAHLVYGPVKDLHDPHGLWLSRVQSEIFHEKDGSEVLMDVMIPWRYVIALGVVDETVPLQPGLNGATVLKTVSPKRR